MNLNKSTLLQFVVCGLLVFLTADLQAQLLYKTKFLAVEGYTDGWAIGQPSIGRPWENLNDNDAYPGVNNGRSYWDTDGINYPIATITNATATGGGQMKVASDGNKGTNGNVYHWGIPIGTRSNGPVVAVTWDWQFFPTNPIPADYDPTNNNYNAGQNNNFLIGWDEGFCLADRANATLACDGSAPNWVFCCNSSVSRLSQVQDCRYNGIGNCGGGGSWYNIGPEFKDGKKLHMRCEAYGGLTGDSAGTNNTFSTWAQRDGEEVWQTAEADPNNWGPGFGDRSCPGEADPTSGINMITQWMNSSDWKFGSYVLVSNIRVVGANPVAVPTISIAKVGADVRVTFTGWLEAADDPKGPYTTVAVTAYPYTTPTVYAAPAAGAKKFYRANM